jgi:hypothetical protein
MHFHRSSADGAETLITRVPLALAMALCLLLVVAIYGQLSVPLVLGALVWGGIAFPLVVLSWHLRSWFSWLVWAVPVAAGAGLLLSEASLGLGLSIPSVMLTTTMAGMFAFFTLLWLFRGWVRRIIS